MNLSLLWLRRDLRLHDHAALYRALENPGQVQPVFIFDTDVLERFTNTHDRRLSFIAQALRDMDKELRKRGGGLLVLHGSARKCIPKLASALGASRVIAAEDYEPSAIARDKEVAKSVPLTLVKDQVIFSPTDIVKGDGTPYKVFTPYSKAWLAALTPMSPAPYAIKDKGRYADIDAMQQKAKASGLRVIEDNIALQQIKYCDAPLSLWPVQDAQKRLKHFIKTKVTDYNTARDLPAQEGTSRLSPYLRFGLISVRECLRAAEEAKATKWISELIWREFYAMILYHFPDSVEWEWNAAYRKKLPWSHDKKLFRAWQEGKTGFPIVDAAMRQLLAEGWMHNRTRMIVASFLTKDLHIDWRLGEEHFAQHLMDYEQASNVGGWQWAASTGTDAQPWFRIFNPELQSRKFDPDGAYIRKYVTELSKINDDTIHAPLPLIAREHGYPQPIVDHAEAREHALSMFKRAAK